MTNSSCSSGDKYVVLGEIYNSGYHVLTQVTIGVVN